MLTARGYESRSDWTSKPIDDVLNFELFSRNPWSNLRARMRFSASLCRLTDGRPFSLLIPGLGPWRYLTLATQPTCKEIFLIEEGIGSFSRDGITTRPLGSRPAWVRMLLYGRAIGRRAGTERPDLIDGAFAMSDDAFGWLSPERRFVVDIKFQSEPRSSKRTKDAVLVVERVVEEGFCSLEAYLRALRVGLNHLATSGAERLLVKDPPGLSEVVSSAVRDLARSAGFNEVLVLEGTTSLEELSWRHRPILLGVMSSALFYGARFGSTAISLADHIDSVRIAQGVQELDRLWNGTVERI